MGLFANEGLAFEDNDVKVPEVDTGDKVEAGSEEPADAVDSDSAEDEVADGDEGDESISDDENGVDLDDEKGDEKAETTDEGDEKAETTDEDDEACCDDELETTMNPAADNVEVSEDGYATEEGDDAIGDETTDEDDDLGEPDVTAPTPFNPTEIPESNIPD